jgi:hypothetical protein
MLQEPQQQTRIETPNARPDPLDIQVTVDYLPATKPFHNDFEQTTILETVRTEAMVFFGVRDRQERDTFRYFLEFEKVRVTNTSQTLKDLLGPHRRGAHFNLIEEVTPGYQKA